MKRWWAWALAGLALVLLIGGLRHKFFFATSSPQCQACHDQAVNTAIQCESNACTNAGGQNNGPAACNISPDNPQAVDRYHSLVQACVAQETSSLNYCKSVYHCP
jgi:hypothetical protein